MRITILNILFVVSFSEDTGDILAGALEKALIPEGRYRLPDYLKYLCD